MDRSTKNFVALALAEALVLVALAYLALVEEVIDVMTMVYVVVGLSVVTVPLYFSVLQN